MTYFQYRYCLVGCSVVLRVYYWTSIQTEIQFIHFHLIYQLKKKQLNGCQWFTFVRLRPIKVN